MNADGWRFAAPESETAPKVAVSQNPDRVASDIERLVDATFRGNPRVDITNFTPSIKNGRRYIGLRMDGTPMLVTIHVEEC